MPEAVTIKGLPELDRKLDNLQDLKKLVPALKAASSHLKGSVAQYPPQSDANAARGFNSFYSMKTRKPVNTWYQRGYGPKWVRKDGTVKGRKTSETLGRKWTRRINRSDYSFIVGNNVSYGEYVQDKGKQARFHKRRGWKTIQDVVKEETDTVVRFVKAEVDKILAK